MSSPAIVQSIIFIFLVVIPRSVPFVENNLTVYEVLEEYDFPVGILPEGVTSYELDKSTGKFTAHLNHTCTFTVDGYELKYKTKISGVISNDTIKNLSGVQVKVVFIWLNIGEVTREGDQLDFSVGISSDDFSVENFLESPQCGCGFDCVNRVRLENLSKSRFFS